DLSARYRDPGQPATAAPAAIPDGLLQAALAAAGAVRFDAALATRFLGCWLTEPNVHAVFPEGPDIDLDDVPPSSAIVLDRRSRMLYRGRQLFINGECAPVAAEAGLRR